MNKAILLEDKFMLYHNCTTLEALGEHLETKQSSISSWKIRNSVVGIKKKCISLGIYDEIFKDFNFENNELDINEILLFKTRSNSLSRNIVYAYIDNI